MGVVSGLVGLLFLAYFGLMSFFIIIGVFTSKTARSRIIRSFWIISFFIGPFIFFGIHETWINFLYRRKTNAAWTLFYERCFQAAEKVYNIADNVEGVLLLNIRKQGYEDIHDRHWPDAGLPKEYGNDKYIRVFLYGKIYSSDLSRGNFSYVDVQEGDGFMRYRLKGKNHEIQKERSPPELARYAVSFVNHNHPEDRKSGIAGTTVIIQDTWTKETMAEKTWYSFEPRFAATDSGRWDGAATCPKDNTNQPTIKFVTQVLQPQKEQ